ncbi:TlpA family protein disulfide reductase [Chitinophaga sedimenti]|nr:TlpA family protein disulfide reductase [Chitinophaga sedimenti]
MADTELKDLAGKKHQLADFKGKYLLIDFWSIGCGPCIAAMPELKKLHESAPANLAVISLSLDQSEETWKAATAHVKMDWTNLSDGKGMAGLAANYGVTGIPHYIIISPEGVLLESWVGYSEGDLEKKISKFVQR